MPIFKSIALKNGVTVTYWRIDKLMLDVPARQLWVDVGGYLSREGYDAGHEPVVRRQACFDDEAFATLFESTQGLRTDLVSLIRRIEPAAIARIAPIRDGTPE